MITKHISYSYYVSNEEKENVTDYVRTREFIQTARDSADSLPFIKLPLE